MTFVSNQFQVLLAKQKSDGKFYAVKVLQKKVILKKNEVNWICHLLLLISLLIIVFTIHVASLLMHSSFASALEIESNLILCYSVLCTVTILFTASAPYSCVPCSELMLLLCFE